MLSNKKQVLWWITTQHISFCKLNIYFVNVQYFYGHITRNEHIDQNENYEGR